MSVILRATEIKCIRTMIKRYKSSAGNISPETTTVIQLIVSDGENHKTSGEFIDKIVKQDKKEVSFLEDKISQLERLLNKCDTVQNYQEKEVFELKTTTLATKEKQIEENEERYAAVLLDLDGKDLTKTNKLYATACEAFPEANIELVIKTLNRQAIIEAREKLEQEKNENEKCGYSGLPF